MATKIDQQLTAAALQGPIEQMFEHSARKIAAIEKAWDPGAGTPVFTVAGRYTSRGWTEWTQGFQFGAALLQFDATGDSAFLELGRRRTVERMAGHLSHVGVHDHGFNNVSTYGNLLRLLREGRMAANEREREFYELALKVSGAVQAARWTRLADGTGFIHSFNGAHSLFVDTIRSCRSLALAHRLGHVLMAEQDARVSLLQRLLEHALNTARYSIYYGRGRDAYDVRGRTAHESVFNVANGVYRCPNSQQGYSPFSTWTRGLAWAICGLAEQLEFLATLPVAELDAAGAGRSHLLELLEGALATAEFYLEHSCADGIPMWDTGAPQLRRMPASYLDRRSDPENAWEPVDSSAAAIAAQGFWRLGNVIAGAAHNPASGKKSERRLGSLPIRPSDWEPLRKKLGLPSASVNTLARRYQQAGLTLARTLLAAPYLSTDPRHQGLLLHSVYHRPNGWDYIRRGQKVPNGESSMWGDYHLRELGVLLLREATGGPYLTFFGGLPASVPQS